MDDLNSFDLDAMMQSGADEEQIDALKKQLALANAMRGNAMNQSGIDMGRVYVAQSPLNILAAGMGGLQAKRAQSKIDALTAQQGAGRKSIIDKLYGRQLRQNDPGMRGLGLPDNALVPMPRGNF